MVGGVTASVLMRYQVQEQCHSILSDTGDPSVVLLADAIKDTRQDCLFDILRHREKLVVASHPFVEDWERGKVLSTLLR